MAEALNGFKVQKDFIMEAQESYELSKGSF